MENTHVNESILSAEILEDQKKNRIDHMKYLKGMEDIGSEVLDKVVSEMEAYDYDKYNEADVRRALPLLHKRSIFPEWFPALLLKPPEKGMLRSRTWSFQITVLIPPLLRCGL